MKTLLFILGGLMFTASSIGIFSCRPVDTQSLKEELTEHLTAKPWALESIDIPPNTVTTPDDWDGFGLDVLPTRMNTSGHAPGGMPVWPSGDWVLAEDGKTITREDGVVMNVRELTATSLVVTFVHNDGADGGAGTDGRIASLNGEYTFRLK